MTQIRSRRREMEMKMSRSSIINIQREWRRGILSRKRIRRTTVVSVTKMLQQHSLSSLRDGPLGPALDPSKPQSPDYFHRWDTSKTSRFPLENCRFLFKIRSFPHEIRAWPGGRVPARKKNSKAWGKKKPSVLVSERRSLVY